MFQNEALSTPDSTKGGFSINGMLYLTLSSHCIQSRGPSKDTSQIPSRSYSRCKALTTDERDTAQGSFLMMLVILPGKKEQGEGHKASRVARGFTAQIFLLGRPELNFRAVIFWATPPTEDTLCTLQVRLRIKTHSVCNDLNKA